MNIFLCCFVKATTIGLNFKSLFQNRTKLNRTTKVNFNTYLSFY